MFFRKNRWLKAEALEKDLKNLAEAVRKDRRQSERIDWRLNNLEIQFNDELKRLFTLCDEVISKVNLLETRLENTPEYPINTPENH